MGAWGWGWWLLLLLLLLLVQRLGLCHGRRAGLGQVLMLVQKSLQSRAAQQVDHHGQLLLQGLLRLLRRRLRLCRGVGKCGRAHNLCSGLPWQAAQRMGKWLALQMQQWWCWLVQ